MFVTVGDLLKHERFEAVCVLAGERDLQRSVKGVADCSQSRDLYVDQLVAVNADQFDPGLFKSLGEAGASGIAVMGWPPKAQLPDAFATLVKELHVAVVTLPQGMGVHELGFIVYQENLKRHEALLKCTITSRRFFMNGALENGDFGHFLWLLARRLRRSVAFVGESGSILGQAAYPDDAADELQRVLNLLPLASTVSHDNIEICLGDDATDVLVTQLRRLPADRHLGGELVRYVPVQPDSPSNGAIVIWPGDAGLSTGDAIGISMVAVMGILEILKRRAELSLEANERRQIVDDLLTGAFDTRDSVERRAHAIGLDLSGEFSILVVESTVPDAVISAVRQCGIDLGLDVLAQARGSDVVVFLSHPLGIGSKNAKQRAMELGKAIFHMLNVNSSGPKAYVGIGRFRPDFARLPISYGEAKKALAIGRAIVGKAGVVHYDDLGVYRIITKCSDRSELELFAYEVLGDVIDYDKKKGTSLLTTLRVYFDSGSSVTATAEKLFVHVNTVKHRLGRIADICGLDLASTDDQMQAYMALKVLDFLRA